MIVKDKAFSSIDFVGQCLVDEKRVSAFKKVINKVVKKNDVVLDLGTGSGIMALLAARAGAKKVYAIELDPFVAEIAMKAIKVNKLDRVVDVVVNDVRKLNLPNAKKINVVISEMITTAMVDEPQIKAINNLHDKKLIDDSTLFLPCRQVTHISLVCANFSIFGFKIPMALHLWKWHKWSNLNVVKMTDKLLLNSISFNKKNNEKFETTLTFKAKNSGRINGIHLTSKTFLTDEIFLEDTEALNAPMFVPIKEKLVKKRQNLKLKISYLFGRGYGYFKAEII